MSRATARASFKHFLLVVLLLAAAVSDAGNNQWTSGGPYGGSISQFAFNPQNKNLLFVSGKSVYRTTTGGTKWERMTVEDFGSIVRIHPADPATTIAAGSFVFASTNQGVTWKEISVSPFQGSRLNDLEFHPSNPQILAGVSDTKGVFISVDGGRTWSSKNSGMAPIGGVQIEFDPVNGDILYVLQRKGRFWKSVDRGNSWKSFNTGLSAGNGRGLAADPKRSGTLYMSSVDQVFKTGNGGGQWTLTGCDCHVEALVVDPNDSRNVYGAGEDAVRSNDGGATWKRMSLPRLSDTRLLGVGANPYVRNSVLIGSQGEGIFRSMNGGIAWSRINNGLDALIIRNISLSGRGPDQIFAVGQIQLFRSKNGGGSWMLGYQGTSPLDSTLAVEAHPQNGSLVAAAGCCTVAISANGGSSYRLVTLSNSGAPLQADLVAWDPLSQNRMFITPLNADFNSLGIMRSTDQGRTFQPDNSGFDTSQKIRTIVPDPKTGQIVLAGTRQGRIYRSVNGGSSWANSSNGLRGGDVISISMDPDNINNVYAVSGNFLYKSTNAGVSWSFKPLGLSAIPNFVTVDAFEPGRIFAGTFGGLLISKDAGETWSAFSSAGLGPFQVTGMMNDPREPNSFYAGTERGVYHYKIAAQSSGPGAPLIEQVSPAAAAAGSTVSLSGSNFGTGQGSSHVAFAGTDAGAAVSWSGNKIQVRVPAGAQTGDVTVTTSTGRSNGYQFVLLPASSGAVQPAGGPAAGGTRVSIKVSSRFTSGIVLVSFGTTLADDVQFTPPDAITCTSPPGSGTVDVYVIAISPTRQRVGSFTYQ